MFNVLDDKTRLSYWFPIIEKSGIKVPKTDIIYATKEEVEGIWDSFETEVKSEKLTPLVNRITEAADKIGYPCFLRTDHFSGKHDWERTCYIKSAEDIRSHVVYIAYMWEMVNPLATPCDVWVVRELLSTIPYGVCKKYGNMPICKEFRLFVREGEILCVHPYWPLKSLESGGAEYFGEFDYAKFCEKDDSGISFMRTFAIMASKKLPGCWSMDFLETKDGWYLTDMAEAHRSFHWEGCKMVKIIDKEQQ